MTVIADSRNVTLQRRYLAGALSVCVLCVLFGVVALFLSPREESTKTRMTVSPAESQLRKALNNKTAPAEATTPARQAEANIAEYKKRLESDPNSSDTPAVLSAMGNLYRQKLMDYKEAARCYERIILDYPQWEGAAAIYPLLSTCYEKSGDYQGMLWIHQEMMKRFPADSQEYLYAKQQLGM